MAIYQTCIAQHGNDTLNVVQCVVNWIENDRDNDNFLDTFRADMINWLLVLTGALVFFMQAGFAMVCAGAIRKKNVNNTVSSTRKYTFASFFVV